MASDILRASGRAIIQAIIGGQEDVQWLAYKAKDAMRGKRADLRLLLRKRVGKWIKVRCATLKGRRRTSRIVTCKNWAFDLRDRSTIERLSELHLRIQ